MELDNHMPANFENREIRRILVDDEWFFSVIDVVGILSDSSNARDYWFKMKQRVKLEDGFEPSTICRQFKLKAPDGKMRLTDCANVEALLRIIQSIPSPKAEPFKLWLAKVGYERIKEIAEAERADGMKHNAEAAKKGGKIAKSARTKLEEQTGQSIVTGENFLPPSKRKKKIDSSETGELL